MNVRVTCSPGETEHRGKTHYFTRCCARGEHSGINRRAFSKEEQRPLETSRQEVGRGGRGRGPGGGLYPALPTTTSRQ